MPIYRNGIMFNLFRSQIFNKNIPSVPGLAVVGSVPTLPTANTTVNTRQGLIDAVAAAPTGTPYVIAISGTELDVGQTNLAQNGFTDTSLTLTITGKDITIIPANGYGALRNNPYGDGRQYAWEREKTCTIKGFFGVTATGAGGDFRIIGFNFTADKFPIASTNTVANSWADIGIADSSNSGYFTVKGNTRVKVEVCEFFMGKNINHDPLVIGEKLWDHNSPTKWRFVEGSNKSRIEIFITGTTTPNSEPTFDGHGDADFPIYNRFAKGPNGLYTNDWSGSSFILNGCVFRDLSRGCDLTFNNATTQPVCDITNCRFDRIYGDMLRPAWRSASKPPIQRIGGNIFLSPMGDAKDGFNPHTDIIQSFAIDSTAGVWKPEPHHRWWNNIAIVYDNDRTSAQCWYPQPSQRYGTGVLNKLVGMELLDCISVNMNKHYSCGGEQSTMIDGSVGISRDSAGAQLGQVPGSIEIARGYSPAISYDAIPDTYNLIRNSIFENYAAQSIASTIVEVNCAKVGNKASRSIPLDNVFLNPVVTLSSVNDVFGMVAREAAHSNKGPQHATLADYLTAPCPNRISLGFVPMTGAALNSLVTSEMAYLHGTVGTSVTIVPDAGEEWRTLDALTETEINAWSSTSGTALAGQLIQRRITTPNTSVTQTTKTLTYNGIASTWSVLTQSNVPFPLADFTTARMRKTTALSGVSADNRKISALIALRPGTMATQQILLAGATGARFQLARTASNNIQFLLRGVGSVPLLTMTSPQNSVVASTINVFFFSADLDRGTTYDEVVMAYKGSSPITNYLGSFNATNAATSSIYMGDTTWNAFATATPNSYFDGDLQHLMIWPGQYIDWSVAATRNKYATELMTDGSEFNGVRPAIMFNGNATTLNSTNGANLGTGGNFDNDGTDVVQL